MCKLNLFLPSRRSSHSVSIGNLSVGANYGIAVQTMCNTHTYDVEDSVKQILNLQSCGADLVRLTVPSQRDVEALNLIRQKCISSGLNVPLCADVHFKASLAFSAAKIVEKVRVNPGNFAAEDEVDDKFTELLALARSNNVAIRVGVNHGSLSPYMMNKWGDTPKGMVESAMEFLRIAKREDFKNIVVSLKSSNPRVMVESYRLCVSQMELEDMTFPLHIGVTEAGEGLDGRIRSSVGIGALLADGIGDTIRVSLTEDPAEEIPVGRVLANYYEYIWENTDFSVNYKNIPLAYDPYIFRRSTNFTPIVIGRGGDYESPGSGWLYVNCEDDADNVMVSALKNPSQPVVVSSDKVCWVGDMRYLISLLRSKGVLNPVILRKNYCNLSEDIDIIAAAEMGAILIDGIADGVWVEKDGQILDSSLGYAILQAVHLRLTRAEIISCPGCGRTMYDLQSVAKAVKERFSKYKGIKIAVMGCIVNGPGEMADADWGYVGAGGGKVTIYRGHEPVFRNVEQSEALDLLEQLINKEDNNEN